MWGAVESIHGTQQAKHGVLGRDQYSEHQEFCGQVAEQVNQQILEVSS